MIDFSNVKSIIIPQGEAIRITSATTLLWEKAEEVIGRIPAEYQEVEWIKAAANVGACLDLGFSFDTGAEIYMSQWIYSTATTAYTFGSAENSGKLRCMLTCPSNGSYAYIYGSTGTTYGNASVAITGNATTGNKTEFKMVFKKNNRYIANLTTGVTGTVNTGQGEFTMASNLYLLAQNYNGTARFGAIRQIGYFQYYNNDGELICDLIPCYRKSDGVIGMYDLARKIFLANVGTGTFTKGADV